MRHSFRETRTPNAPELLNLSRQDGRVARGLESPRLLEWFLGLMTSFLELLICVRLSTLIFLAWSVSCNKIRCALIIS